MLVSSVSQHIWSLKLRKEDGSALKCMSGLRAGVWWVRLEVLINHTEPSSAFSLSFIPLCRSGDRSGVTLSCNKCFEGRRPDIVFEITRPVCVCVCSHTAAVILWNWPFVRLLHILHYSYSFLLSRKSRINPSSPSLLLCLPNWLQKQIWSSLSENAHGSVSSWLYWQQFSISYWVTVLRIDSPLSFSYHWCCDLMIWSLLLPLILLNISQPPNHFSLDSKWQIILF